jgi:hypothetical protein
MLFETPTIERPRLKRLFELICAIALALAAWAILIGPDRLVVNEARIELPSWPNELKGLRIAVISDLHPGGLSVTRDKLRLVVEKANQTRPDLILLAGDFVDTALGLFVIDPEITAAELKNLRAQHGVFAVLGNHDWWLDGARVRKSLEDAGIKVLDNEVARLELPELNGQRLWIAGFGDLWEGTPNVDVTLSKISNDAPVIAVTHNPDLFPRIPARVALTVAGHTHGGQVALPLLGRPIVPSKFGERFAAGHIVEEGRHLFVTTGIGVSILPVRFGVPPEIALLTLDSGNLTTN